MNDRPLMTSLTVGVVFALFAVWMQRHQRWGYFVNGLTGRYIITGSRGTGAGGTPSSTSPSASGGTPAPATPTPAPLKITQM